MPTLAGKPLVYSPSRPRHLDYARAGQSTQLYPPRHARTCCKKVCSPGRIAPTFGTQSFVSHVARQRRRGLSSCPSFESASTSSTSGELSGPWGRCGTLSDVQHAWRKPTSSLCWKENCCRHLLDSGDPIKHIFLTSLSPLQHIVTRLAQMVGSRQASAGSVALAYFRLAKLVCDSAWALIKLTVHARSVGAAHLRAFGVAMAQRSTRRLGACAANAWRMCSSDVASCEQTKDTPCAAEYWP